MVIEVPPAVVTVMSAPATRSAAVVRVASFSPAEVRLLGSPFAAARDRHAGYLLSLNADRFLARFRSEAGLTPRAEEYGGWEKNSISGHSLGHYLSACAKMYAGTGDERFKARVAYIVGELAACQAANGNGYVGAIPGGRKAFDEVAAGNIRSQGFDLNGLWVPWYTLHKLYAGLRDAHQLCGDEEAKRVLVGLSDWAVRTMAPLTDEQFQKMLDCEHGGMNEVLADVYAMTGNAAYAKLAQRFNHRKILEPLSRGVDELAGKHANTQIPKVIGAAREAELLRDVDTTWLADAATFFWTRVTQHHSYANGGHSLDEHFGKPDVIAGRLTGNNTAETCNTYNMLKLTRHLHGWDGHARYYDFYERALYNHILASQDPAGAGVVYFLPLRAGARKTFQGLEDAWTCCVGTGMENHASYGDAIYAKAGADLLVNLFIPSTLTWGERGIAVRQETAYPVEGRVRLTVEKTPAGAWAMKLRKPGWAGSMSVKVNGSLVAAEVGADGYVSVSRGWAAGDVVEAEVPLGLRAEATPDDAGKTAVFFGPVLLVADLGATRPEARELPVLVTERGDWLSGVKRTEAGGLRFVSEGLGRPGEVAWVPFYEVKDEHYAVYLDRMSEAQYAAHRERLVREAEAARALEARTIDFVQPGEMQPERDHDFKGEKTTTGEYQGRKWRHATDGGWFEFTFKVPAVRVPPSVVVTYWGGDGNTVWASSERHFEIYAGGRLLATEALLASEPGRFFDREYRLPQDLVFEGGSLTVKFVAKSGKIAGGVYGVRIIRND